MGSGSAVNTRNCVAPEAPLDVAGLRPTLVSVRFKFSRSYLVVRFLNSLV